MGFHYQLAGGTITVNKAERGMTRSDRVFSAKEVLERGQPIYDRLIRPKLEAEHRGRLVGIDVESEQYEIGDDTLEVCDRLRSRRPNALIALIRIGGGPVDRIGYSPPRGCR
jgi:hypothetical protein